MKILQIVPRIPSPPHDGGAVYIYHATRHLAALGNTIYMLGFISNLHTQDCEDMQQYVQLKAVAGDFKPYTIFPVLKAIATWQPVTIQHRMDIQKFKPLVYELDFQPDVILFEGIHSMAFFDLIKQKFPHVPTVLRQSNVEYLLLKRNSQVTKNPFIKGFYYQQSMAMKRYELKAMAKVDAVTAITPYDQAVFLDDLPGLNCFVSPAGTTLPPDLKLSRYHNRLLAISNWRWKPNYDGLEWFLQHVWPELVTAIPDLEFDIIGAGLPTTFMERFRHKNLHFRGFVDDLEPYRQTATIFVAPLFSGSGMKLKIVEGLASGLPIVTSSYGAEGIDINPGEHYMLANNKQEFINSIQTLLADKQLRENISQKAKAIVSEKYTWPELAGQLHQFLETLV